MRFKARTQHDLLDVHVQYINMRKHIEFLYVTVTLIRVECNMERTDLAGCWRVLLTNQKADAGFSQTSAAEVGGIQNRPRRVATAAKY